MVKEIFGCRWLKLIKIDSLVVYPFILYRKMPSKKLRKHEFKHIKQIKQEGLLRFSLIYVYEYAKNRIKGMKHSLAYRAISYEKSAYNS